MEKINPFALADIELLVKEKYQIFARAEALNGYDEWNYKLTDPEGKKYILKVSADASAREFIKAQTEVLEKLQHSSLAEKFPKCITAADGNLMVEEWRHEEGYCFRLLSFLEGSFWVDMNAHSLALYESLGGFLGKMDAFLSGYKNNATRRDFEWDLQNTLWAYDKLSFVKEVDLRRVIHYFLQQYETHVLPRVSQLRKSLIHNDANDYNVLVADDEVTGLIDFGDMVYSHTVNNLAVACTYAMLNQSDALSCAEAVVRAYHNENPLKEAELDILYYLIAARLCISLVHAAEKRATESKNQHHYITEKHAHQLILHLITVNPLLARSRFLEACGYEGLIHESNYEGLLEKRRKYVGKSLSISYREPLKIDRGALQYLYDDKGRTYVDCVNNVSHLGHCHPRLVAAMQKQIATLNTNTRYLNDAMVEYSEALLATLPDNLQVCFFVNSGSEANDLAIRMSRMYTGFNDVIVLDHAYHGTTSLAIELSPYKFDGPGGFAQKSFVHKAENPDVYRGRYKVADKDAGVKYAADVKRILTQISNKGGGVAAFICETLLGVGGQIPLPEGYLPEVYKYVKEMGGVCIADEVQVGFGRVGEKFWGFELQGVLPDIVVAGKPIGNGHPMAAVITTPEIAQSFNNGMEYFNTYGGNPVSMVTGLEVLRILEEEKLQENAKRVGGVLLEHLADLKKKHCLIGDVRGKGLFVGVELVKDPQTLQPAMPQIFEIVEAMKERGFLLSTDGPLNNVLKIKPPMVFSEQNAKDLARNLDEVLTELNKK